MADVETRVSILEHDLDNLRASIGQSLSEITDDIREIKNTLDAMNSRVNEIDKKIDTKFERYNSYSEKFATKIELMNVQQNVERLRSELEGRNDALVKIGAFLGALSTLVLVFEHILGHI